MFSHSFLYLAISRAKIFLGILVPSSKGRYGSGGDLCPSCQGDRQLQPKPVLYDRISEVLWGVWE